MWRFRETAPLRDYPSVKRVIFEELQDWSSTTTRRTKEQINVYVKPLAGLSIHLNTMLNLAFGRLTAEQGKTLTLYSLLEYDQYILYEAKQKNMCVSGYMLLKIRVGR